MVKERADWITRNDHGRGVAELVEKLIASDLREIESGLRRHEVALGARDDGQELRLKPYGVNVLVAGTSGGGKTTLQRASSSVCSTIATNSAFSILKATTPSVARELRAR